MIITSNRDQATYVTESLKNVKALEELEKERGIKSAGVTELHSKEDIKKASRVGGASGDQGYINHGSGWADAEMAMRFIRSQVEASGRVKFVIASVKRLSQSEDGQRITGAVLSDGTELPAALTVVAAGAWTPSLLDLRGLCTATGQILAYIELTADEQDYLSKCPVQLNMSTGMFLVPPPPLPSSEATTDCEASRHTYLKIARHGYGYSNPIAIQNPESKSEDEQISVSVPHTMPSAPFAAQTVPAEALDACRASLHEFLPSDPSLLPPEAPKSIASIHTRPFTFARLCHYTDTPSGNYLIAYHPKYNDSLFVATGGSGHGFKFVPVLGDEIVNCILGECSDDFKEKWAWPSDEEVDVRKKETVEEGGAGWTGDGSRGGCKGMTLSAELKKGEGDVLAKF